MQLPLQITWRDVPRSDALEASIRKKAEKLAQFSDHIIHCHVVVETSERHHHQGNLYRLHLRIKVPDNEIIITRDSGKDHSHEDMYVAIRDAFDAARRQLQNYIRRRQGKVKQHDIHRKASVIRLFPDDDYGFIQSPDGQDIYFHRNAVIDTAFEALKIGDVVHYVAELGDEGWQAKQVSVPKNQPQSA